MVPVHGALSRGARRDNAFPPTPNDSLSGPVQPIVGRAKRILVVITTHRTDPKFGPDP